MNNTSRPWDGMSAAELFTALVEGHGEFAWLRGQLKVALAMSSARRYIPIDAGLMREIVGAKSAE